ncbi:hypothetical protein [Mycolicibacterium pallens]|uniref:4a-hydroxytetrahydrobiopterin dehydratase n=1 Tax=Mycolicibacterium pallens TaxID=370524 RepID=A0ABX8VMX2_9MYCO|nr:hypothetical protein [Mycolicibacterium pallens]QYL19155.1 hypothetical protein K0O64_12080 [Mycolicibacterium pallens]
MRIDAAKNHIDAEVWSQERSPRVRFRIGWQRYTATADEAVKFAEELLRVAEEVRNAS